MESLKNFDKYNIDSFKKNIESECFGGVSNDSGGDNMWDLFRNRDKQSQEALDEGFG